MREDLARRIGSVAVASLVVGSSLVAVGRAQTSESGTSLDPQNFGQIERGRYLTVVGDCASCHTVPGSGQPFAGGRPIETPFGVVVGANITPDRETGIGAWSDEVFLSALREGKGHGGLLLYPAMPYPYYTKATERDALAIRAYLNTVRPVRNAVVSNKLPFPFDVREEMTVWNSLYFKSGEFKPDPAKSAEWNRGAYLVERRRGGRGLDLYSQLLGFVCACRRRKRGQTGARLGGARGSIAGALSLLRVRDAAGRGFPFHSPPFASRGWFARLRRWRSVIMPSRRRNVIICGHEGSRAGRLMLDEATLRLRRSGEQTGPKYE